MLAHLQGAAAAAEEVGLHQQASGEEGVLRRMASEGVVAEEPRVHRIRAWEEEEAAAQLGHHPQAWAEEVVVQQQWATAVPGEEEIWGS